MSFKGLEAKWTAYTKEVKKSGDKSQISDAETVAGSVKGDRINSAAGTWGRANGGQR